MIFEGKVEKQFINELLKIDELRDANIIGSRQNDKSEDASKFSVIGVSSGFRTHDDFSLPFVVIPFSLTIASRVENDNDERKHDLIVEKIVNLLSRWHKKCDEMREALSNENFLGVELKIDGGSTPTRDDNKMIWYDTIQFSVRGTERFYN